MQPEFPKIEEKVLQQWKAQKAFAKSLQKRKKGPIFTLYDGPPTANAGPGMHHMVNRAFKDVVVRYKTMQGFYTPRKAGWDTHGLPVELQIEKKLGLTSKKDIEQYGIVAFNKACQDSVWNFKGEWERFNERVGLWIDMEHPYITYDTAYIESLWYIISQFAKKGYLYKDYKVVPYCTRCGTPESSHELAQGYKTVKEPAVYVKFKAQSTKSKTKSKVKVPQDTYFVAWTTTPWTLPSNVALAVHPDLQYVVAQKDATYYIVAQKRAAELLGEYKVVKTVQGKDLVGITYEPLFSFGVPEQGKKIYEVVPAAFVSDESGSGIAHEAPAYGAEDFDLGKKENLAMLHLVNEQGKFKQEVTPWQGIFVKDADPLIIQELEKKGLLFKQELYEHEYPHCWRCSTPLLYYAKDSWFVNMQKVKKQLIANNNSIAWYPEHIKKGRMGEWLKEVKDWAFSRERYWGTPLPIWECESCDNREVIGSLKELFAKKGLQHPYKNKKDVNLHRPFIDQVTFACTKCKETMKRVQDVVDVWFDSGAMPFAQNHWLGGKVKDFPADYIVEAIDQTRGWFYTLLAVATLLGKKAPFRNAISLGHMLDAKGEKMSKSKGNIVNPWDMIEKYGIDTLRWYFFTLNHPGDPKLFAEQDVQLAQRKFMLTLWNSFVFYETYAVKKVAVKNVKPKNVLDQWIFSRLNTVAGEMTKAMDAYDITGAARLLESFVIDDLSLWYIRRSRSRFQSPVSQADLNEASVVLRSVLANVCTLAAPFIPFVTEEIFSKVLAQDWKGSRKGESVHLQDWAEYKKRASQAVLEKDMQHIRDLVTKGLAARAAAGIKVRQPLASLTIQGTRNKIQKELLELLKDELNVKEVLVSSKLKKEVVLDTVITPELQKEGTVRELLRCVQGMRKEAGYKPQDKIRLRYAGDPMLVSLVQEHLQAVAELHQGDRPKRVFDIEREISLQGRKLWLGMKKV